MQSFKTLYTLCIYRKCKKHFRSFVLLQDGTTGACQVQKSAHISCVVSCCSCAFPPGQVTCSCVLTVEKLKKKISVQFCIREANG